MALQLRPDNPPGLEAFIEQTVQAVQVASTLLSKTLSFLKEARQDDTDYQQAFQDLMCVEAQRHAFQSLLNNLSSPGESIITLNDKRSARDTLNTIWEVRQEVADEVDRLSESDEVWVQRKAFNDAIRPFARPLAVHDIPIELWVMIFEQVVGKEGDGDLWLYPDYVAGGRNPIKDIRMTCHLFCDASSHLLFRRVDVALSPDSLARLDKISRHKTFSTSVRAVRVDLSCYTYIDYLARDELAFVKATMHAICRWMQIDTNNLKLNLDGYDFFRWQVGLSHTQREEMIDEVSRTLTVWRAYLDSEGRTPSLDDVEISAESRAAILAVLECHWEYRKRFEEQDRRHVHGSDLARSVAVAMARMPNAVRLFMSDDLSHVSLLKVKDSSVDTPIEAWTQDIKLVVRERMLKPSMTWEQVDGCHWGVPPPGHLLHLIPMSLHQLGVPLLHLNIDMTWSRRVIWDLDDSAVSGLRALAKTLKSFNYHGPPDFPQISGSDIEKYLSAFMSGESLETIDIAFLSERAESMSINTVLASLSSSTKLHSVTLRDCSFHLHQLQSVLLKCKPNGMKLISLHDIELQSGTWADALDVLREAVMDRTTVAYVERPAGAECDTMSREHYSSIFRSGYRQPFEASKANEYVSSWSRTHQLNPLRVDPAEASLFPPTAGYIASEDT